MTRSPHKLAAIEAEGQLSNAILRLTKMAGLDLTEVLKALTHEARCLTGSDFGFFFPIMPELSESIGLGSIVSAGKPPVGSHRVLGKLFPTQILPPMPADQAEAPSDQFDQSWLALPLTSPSGALQGHMILGKGKPDHFGARSQLIASALLAHAALVLDRASLLAAEVKVRHNLSRALAIRENFLSVASHEMRNPLNSLHLRLDILKREASLLAAQERRAEGFGGHVEKAAAQVSRMADLLDRLLDISRISSGRIQLRLRDYNVAGQLERIAERFAEQAAPGQIRLVVRGPAIVSMDELRVDQVITNLLSNAIKYGENKPIEVRLSTLDDWIEVAIADRGTGIPEADQERVFERFERVELDKSQSGFGLGLWISRRIVLAMGGVITLDSEPGKGSTFTVKLPRRVAAGD
jgi:signal transduction histidine kinase